MNLDRVLAHTARMILAQAARAEAHEAGAVETPEHPRADEFAEQIAIYAEHWGKADQVARRSAAARVPQRVVEVMVVYPAQDDIGMPQITQAEKRNISTELTAKQVAAAVAALEAHNGGK